MRTVYLGTSPFAVAVLERLAAKQRDRIQPFDPHAAARWPTEQALAAARADAAS
jgi:hypothetical protein